jgi:hypothetical protein
MSDCKKIKEEIPCKDREDCLWNKSKKCQQKPTRETKKVKHSSSSPVSETSTRSHERSLSMLSEEKISSKSSSSLASVSVDTNRKSKSNSVVESTPGNECILVLRESSITTDIITETPDQERMRILEEQYEKCKKDCDEINKIMKQLKDISTHNTIKGITLDHKKKLIDLLIERVLDPSPDWKQKIDTLINIPTGLTGDNILRGGDYFEALFQLAIAIGVLQQFKGKFVRFYDIHKYKHKKAYPNYLYDKSIKNSGGGEQGISDISFEVSDNILFDGTQINTSYECGLPPPIEVKSSNPFYFISVKGYKREKSIKNDYDIPILDQQLDEFPEILHKHIIVCVRNKAQFEENLKRSKIDFIKHSIHYIIGYDEVIEAFTQFRLTFFRRIKCITPETIDQEVRKIFPKDVIHKQPLQMYFHQELVVRSVEKRIEEMSNSIEEKPHFMCIGVLPRGGKSFIAGGIINSHKIIKNKQRGYNVLFMTSAVNETRGQFKTDLIEKFSDFDDFQFVDVVKENVDDPSKPNKFYFISRQLSSMELKNEEDQEDGAENILKGMFNTLKSKLGHIPEIDIIFFDEAHVGITSTTIRRNFQDAFEMFPVPVILMTATYKKPAVFLDSNKDLFVWDLQDIKDMKGLPVLKLDGFVKKNPDILERYPDIAQSILEERIGLGESLESIAKPYLQFPTPNFISLTFSPDTITYLKDINVGYKFTKAFELVSDTSLLLDYTQYIRWGSLLRHREDALRIRQFLTPEQDLENPDESAVPFLQDGQRKYRALNQIFAIAQKNGSRPMAGRPFSILMFLPFNFEGGSPIGELCRVWASFMLESKYWRENFVFLTLSVYNNKDYKKEPKITLESAVRKGLCHREDFKEDLKDIIIKVEKEALKQGKGLVILSGDVAKMGISLKCVDVVFMMSSSPDADDIIQKMYRALTDDPPYKKDGFIVDLDLKRVITAMFDYDEQKDKMRVKNPVLLDDGERVSKILELCNWGQDTFIEEHTEMDFNTIMDKIKERVSSDLKHKLITRTYFDLEKNQIESIRRDDKIYSEMITILQFTSGKKKPIEKSKPKPEVLGKRGEMIPDIPPEVQASIEDAESVIPPVGPQIEPIFVLSDQEIEQKMFRIIKTFVNALVIKSTESWSGSLNLIALLDKYKKDKTLIEDSVSIHSCNCTSFDDCLKEHDNLYETVFCELSSFAMFKASPQSKLYSYNRDTHNKILDILERIFEKTEFLLEWNHYIQDLLRTVKSAKRFGGRKTIKKYRQYIKTNATRRLIAKI